MTRFSSTVLFLCAFAACGGPSEPPLEISEVDIFAPLPGSNMSVAYMVLANNTADAIVIKNISSPDFASVELHQTQITNGVSRMRSLDSLTVPARSTVALEEGGIHLMLMKPTAALQLDQAISLRINYDSDGIVIVSATLQARIRFEEPR